MNMKQPDKKQVQSTFIGSLNMQNSRTNPALAEKIKQVSARLMQQNHQLYKDLANK